MKLIQGYPATDENGPEDKACQDYQEIQIARK